MQTAKMRLLWYTLPSTISMLAIQMDMLGRGRVVQSVEGERQQTAVPKRVASG
jgi:hypothetical protein